MRGGVSYAAEEVPHEDDQHATRDVEAGVERFERNRIALLVQ